MRQTTTALLAVTLLLGACAAHPPANLPIAGAIAPETGTAGPKSCGDLETFGLRWAERLRLGDWQISIGCDEIPEEEQVWAKSTTYPTRRVLDVVVDPDAPDQELTVLHEFVHGILHQVCASQSDLIHEQEARSISELMLCREKSGDQ